MSDTERTLFEGGTIVTMDAKVPNLVAGLIDARHHAWLGVMRRLMPDVDDLFAYIDVVAEKLGAHYRPIDMYVSRGAVLVAGQFGYAAVYLLGTVSAPVGAALVIASRSTSASLSHPFI